MDLKRKRKILLTQLKEQYDLWQKDDAIRVKRNQEILNHIAKTEEHLKNLLEDLESLKKFSGLGGRVVTSLVDVDEFSRESNAPLTKLHPIESDFLAEAQKRLEAIVESNLGSLSDNPVSTFLSSNDEEDQDIDLLDSSFIGHDGHELLDLHDGIDKVSLCSEGKPNNDESKEQCETLSRVISPNRDDIVYCSTQIADKSEACAPHPNAKILTVTRKVEDTPALLIEKSQDSAMTQSSTDKTTLNSDIPSIKKEVTQFDISNNENRMFQSNPRRLTSHVETTGCPNMDQLLEECGNDLDDSCDPVAAALVTPGVKDEASLNKTESGGVVSEMVSNRSLPTGDHVPTENIVTEASKTVNKKSNESSNKGQISKTLTSGKVLQMFGKLSSLDSDSSSDKNDLSDDFFD